MTIAEKLIELDKNADIIVSCNEQLTQILAGTDTDAKGYYDFFWDNFQLNGTRTNYNNGFRGWGFEYIRPKYKVVPTDLGGAYNIIYSCPSLKKIEAAYFDLSQVPYGTAGNQSHSYLFAACHALEEIEDVGLQPNFSYGSFCAYDEVLKKVACVRLDKASIVTNMLYGCNALEEVTFEGEIGQSGIDLKRSTKLNRASIESLFNCLSTDVTGQSLTLSKTAVNNAFTTDEWNTLVTTRNNWTISLV